MGELEIEKARIEKTKIKYKMKIIMRIKYKMKIIMKIKYLKRIMYKMKIIMMIKYLKRIMYKKRPRRRESHLRGSWRRPRRLNLLASYFPPIVTSAL